MFTFPSQLNSSYPYYLLCLYDSFYLPFLILPNPSFRFSSILFSISPWLATISPIRRKIPFKLSIWELISLIEIPLSYLESSIFNIYYTKSLRNVTIRVVQQNWSWVKLLIQIIDSLSMQKYDIYMLYNRGLKIFD